MNSYEITFSIKDTDKMIAQFKDLLECVGWNYAEPIVFLHNKKLITIAKRLTYFNIRDLRDRLDEVLHNKFTIHKSITNDIGLSYNQYLHYYDFYYNHKIGDSTSGDSPKVWIGFHNHVWQAYENGKKYTTWLYNDHEDNIIFTITPTYEYDRTTKRNIYIPYKKWILQYKPYYTAILSRKTAQEWYNLANMIVTIIDQNMKEFEKDHEEMKAQGIICKTCKK